MMGLSFQGKLDKLDRIEPVRVYGRIDKIVGLTIESEGPPSSVGEILEMENPDIRTPLQVIGFIGNRVISMPLGEVQGISFGQKLHATGRYPSLKVGENFLGRVINGLGQPLDNKGPLAGQDPVDIYGSPTNAMAREPISEILPTGIRAIDGTVTLGKGQRMGIFSGSGVGKSTLLGMIARNTRADVNVIALVGERGRELRDFLNKSLGEEGLKRTVVVAATSDETPLLKIVAAFTATAVAEYFCRQGRDVMLMMDSLTRLAMAQREVGLSAGEPPSTKGYTPSVFTMLPRLIERAGNFSGQGSVTAIYTILVEGDDTTEPISDHARSLLDGHILLSRDLAHHGQYPAVDVLGSISRLMKDIVTDDHATAAARLKEMTATYREAEELINIGAYKKGTSEKIDEAIRLMQGIKDFMSQDVNETSDFKHTLEQLKAALR